MSKYKFAVNRENIESRSGKRRTGTPSQWARGEGLSSRALKKETDFIHYASLLRQFAQRYCVMVAASDTPCGQAFSYEVGQVLTDVGFRINLSGKFRLSYVGMINAGDLLFEEIATDPEMSVEKDLVMGGIGLRY